MGTKLLGFSIERGYGVLKGSSERLISSLAVTRRRNELNYVRVQISVNVKHTQKHTWYVFVLTLTRIVKSVVTEQAPVTLEWRTIPGKQLKQKWYTCLRQYIYYKNLVKYTPAVRSNILSKLIFASYV